MKNETVETPVGAGRAYFNKKVLTHLGFGSRSVDGFSYNVSIIGLNRLTGADQSDAVPEIIARTCKAFSPSLTDLEANHRRAMGHLEGLGWPKDLAFQSGWFQFEADRNSKRNGAVEPSFSVRIMLYAEGPHLEFEIGDDGEQRALFSKGMFDEALSNARQASARVNAPIVKHKTFGSFQIDELVELKRKKFGRRFVSFDLYLPVNRVDAFEPSMLDPFASLRENLDALVLKVTPHLSALREDWAADWLDPLNRDIAGPFLKAFPMAEQGGQAFETAFGNALWLSRVCLSPFGDGEVDPIASWDFHALPKGKDSTVFVVRTRPDGTFVSATTES